MPDVKRVISDPNFQGLPFEEKRKVMSAIDTNFKSLPKPDQYKVMNALNIGQLPKEQLVSDDVKRGVSSFSRPVLEFGGAMGGGVLAAPAGPVGVAAGGALGYAAGKGAANRLDEAMGLKEAPQGIVEGLKETEQGLREGAMAEMGGAVTTKALARGAKAAPAIVEKAKALGVELTPAEIKNSKPWAMLESALDKIPFSSGIIQRFRAKQGQQLENAAEDIIEQIGSQQSKEAVGTAAQDAILKKNYKRLVTRDKLFDRLTKSVPEDSVVAIDNVQAKAEEILLKQSQMAPEDRNSVIIDYLKSKLNKPSQGLSFAGAKATREELTGRIGPVADTAEKQVFKQIKKALDEDIAAFAESSGGKIERAWKKANAFHGAVKDLASDPNIKSVLNSSNPGAIVNSVMNSKNTLQIKLLRKAMPEKEFQKVQSAMIDRLFEGSVNQNPSQALVSNLKKYGDEFLGVAIPKAKLARLKEFGDVAARAKGAEKLAGNPSGTAQNVITFAQGAFFITNPVKGTVAAVAPPVMAKLYLSDFGKKLITEGVSLSPTSARAAGVASALIALSKREK